jgi:hypothetical protein
VLVGAAAGVEVATAAAATKNNSDCNFIKPLLKVLDNRRRMHRVLPGMAMCCVSTQDFTSQIAALSAFRYR